MRAFILNLYPTIPDQLMLCLYPTIPDQLMLCLYPTISDHVTLATVCISLFRISSSLKVYIVFRMFWIHVMLRIILSHLSQCSRSTQVKSPAEPEGSRRFAQRSRPTPIKMRLTVPDQLSDFSHQARLTATCDKTQPHVVWSNLFFM